MKKLAVILCTLMLFSMAACTDNNGNAGDNNNNGDNAGDDIVTEGEPDDMPDVDDKDGNVGKQKLNGTAQGYGGEVSVNVEVNGDDIVSVEAVGDKETQGVGSKAIDELPGKIEEADSTDVEAVSGATVTSNAIKEAVDQALKGKE